MASNTTSVLPLPARVQASKASSAAGSTTSVAPMVVASARRAGEKSVATIVSMPLSFSAATMARPTGPQPSTSAPSPGLMCDLLTPCRPTAIGSVSAAWRKSRPLGISVSSGADRSIRSP